MKKTKKTDKELEKELKQLRKVRYLQAMERGAPPNVLERLRRGVL